MKKYDRITPEGTRDLLFQECAAQRSIMETLRETLNAEDITRLSPGL
jgi:ATP phosphoribosyltransferase regulatory subunit